MRWHSPKSMWLFGVLYGLGGQLVRLFTMCRGSYDMLFGLFVGALIVLMSRLHMVMRGGGVVSRRG